MRWRLLEPENSNLQADGNGHIMNTTDARGLGIVLKLASAGAPGPFPRIIPSAASDKLTCGIIPGDPDFVDQDYSLVGNDRKPINIEINDQILERIGVPCEQREKFKKHRWRGTQNEIIILLCPFLPLEGSMIAGFHFPATIGRADVRCTFRSWECRVVFRFKIKDRISALKGNFDVKILEEISDWIDFLEHNHKNDFYCRYDQAAITNKHKQNKGAVIGTEAKTAVEAKTLLLQKGGKNFRYTTKELKQLKFDEEHQDGQKMYVHLVAAQESMTIDAIEESSKRRKVPDEKTRCQKDLENWYDGKGEGFALSANRGPGIDTAFMESAKSHVMSFEAKKSHRGITKFLHRKDINYSEEDVEVAWWLLMLRGTAWAMSTRRIDKLQFGEFITSSFYGNKTPIWIT